MKLYKILIVLLLVSLVFFVSSCEKEGGIITKEIILEDFDAIDFETFGKVSISYGAKSKIIYKGHEGLFQKLKLNIYKGELIMENLKLGANNYEPEYIITMPLIKNFILGGSADVSINDFNQSDDLNLEISGSGDINVYEFPNCEAVNIYVPGSGRIEMFSDFQKLENLNIVVEGDLDYYGYLLETVNSTINISGTADCKVNVKTNLKIDISGTGNVYYKGFAIIDSDISGVGDIIEQN